ncbi:hypothetical protein CDL15_Pgr008616 [Punica granatum]|uniref:Uncharacterized protein n=1 Tax=Punica granatum TaxID=22663 RepID=A0A218WQP5_PUNGR|nr:hypothetical protein CDL15_Pgr008616 [Punica granatum]PKI56039.1 hypothetical protein CRG98_023579 [Punica granatum]
MIIPKENREGKARFSDFECSKDGNSCSGIAGKEEIVLNNEPLVIDMNVEADGKKEKSENMDGNKVITFQKDPSHKKPYNVAFCSKEVKRILELEVLLQKNSQSHMMRKMGRGDGSAVKSGRGDRSPRGDRSLLSTLELGRRPSGRGNRRRWEMGRNYLRRRLRAAWGGFMEMVDFASFFARRREGWVAATADGACFFARRGRRRGWEIDARISLVQMFSLFFFQNFDWKLVDEASCLFFGKVKRCFAKI